LLILLFTGIATVSVDGRFSVAFIQRQDVDHADESTIFWFNLVLGLWSTWGYGLLRRYSANV